MNVPPEIILEIAKSLDLQSYLSFKLVNSHINSILVNLTQGIYYKLRSTPRIFRLPGQGYTTFRNIGKLNGNFIKTSVNDNSVAFLDINKNLHYYQYNISRIIIPQVKDFCCFVDHLIYRDNCDRIFRLSFFGKRQIIHNLTNIRLVKYNKSSGVMAIVNGTDMYIYHKGKIKKSQSDVVDVFLEEDHILYKNSHGKLYYVNFSNSNSIMMISDPKIVSQIAQIYCIGSIPESHQFLCRLENCDVVWIDEASNKIRLEMSNCLQIVRHKNDFCFVMTTDRLRIYYNAVFTGNNIFDQAQIFEEKLRNTVIDLDMSYNQRSMIIYQNRT